MVPLPSCSPCCVEQMTSPDSIRKQRSVSCDTHRRRTKSLDVRNASFWTTVMWPHEEQYCFAGVRVNHDHDMKIGHKKDIRRARGNSMHQHNVPSIGSGVRMSVQHTLKRSSPTRVQTDLFSAAGSEDDLHGTTGRRSSVPGNSQQQRRSIIFTGALHVDLYTNASWHAV